MPYVVRGAERFFDRPEVREAMLRCAGGPVRRRRGTPLAEPVRAVLSGRWLPPGAAAAAAPPASGGRRWPRWSRSPTAGAVSWRLRGLRRRARRAGRRAARADRARASPWPRCTRQGPGVGRGLPGRPRRGDAADHLRRTPEQVEEERRLLYVGVTRARQHLAAVLGAVPVARADRKSRRPSCFLDGLRPGPLSPSSPAARERPGQRTRRSRAGLRHGAHRVR